MKQMIMKAAFDAGWGGTSQYISLAGNGQIPLSTTFGINYENIVMPIDGIFRNLIIQSQATHPNYILTLMVNNSPTSLLVPLADTETTASNNEASVAVSAGDSVCLRIQVSPIGVGLGYPVSVCIEFEGDEQFYPTQNFSGSVNIVTGPGRRSGILGNGIPAFSADPPLPVLSNTYSIVPAAGNITSLHTKAFGGDPLTGVWSSYLIKNNILQDGTGGTVDTLVTMTGTTVYASNDFVLPVTLADYIEVVILRSVINAPFALAQVTASITFTPDDEGVYLLCGGNNNAFSDTVNNYTWNAAEQLGTPEVIQSVPVGLLGFTATGLYMEVSPNPPGTGKSFVVTLRKNQADTAITFTISDMATTGQILDQEVNFVNGDIATIEITPVNTPTTEQFHWGLIAFLSGDDPPVVPGAGIYELVPGKRYDTLYTDDEGNTEDVKIPDPYFQTGWIGK